MTWECLFNYYHVKVFKYWSKYIAFIERNCELTLILCFITHFHRIFHYFISLFSSFPFPVSIVVFNNWIENKTNQFACFTCSVLQQQRKYHTASFSTNCIQLPFYWQMNKKFWFMISQRDSFKFTLKRTLQLCSSMFSKDSRQI